MIDKYALQERLTALIGDYLKGENAVLVDLKFQTRRRKSLLRILVDEQDGGITVDRCAYLNNAISQLLDEENLIQSSYILEVSSPGVDRPLLGREDFSRCLNRRVRVWVDKGRDQVNEVSGVVTAVSETGLSLDSGGSTQEIPFEQIRKGKQVV